MKESSGKAPRVFYGWWVVGSCLLISLMYGGISILGFTAFFEPIVGEFGWSYTQVSLAASLRGTNVGLLSPLMGFLADRWGPRRLIFIGVILLGLSLFLLSHLTSLVTFYGVFVIIAIANSGLSPTVMITVVGNWFHKNAGMATGILACGFALGSLLVPGIVKLIDIYSWRTAALILAAGILVLGIPLSLLVRNKPEQYGYLPDGERISSEISTESTTPKQAIKKDSGVREALKSHTFWHIGPAMMLLFIPISSVTVHVMPYLSSVGVARTTAGVVAMAIPLVSIIGRLSAGWLGDRFKRTYVAGGFILMVIVGLLFFSYASTERMWALIPFIILFGIGWGSNFPMRAALVRGYFGRSNLGTIFGFMMGLCATGGVIGPMLTGWIFDHYGSYHFAWILFACLLCISIIVMITTPPMPTAAGSDGN
jgi:sugar phosphate permease